MINFLNFNKKTVTIMMQKYNIPTDKFIVGTIGRLERNKGHEVIIKSLTKLSKHIINLCYCRWWIYDR